MARFVNCRLKDGKYYAVLSDGSVIEWSVKPNNKAIEAAALAIKENGPYYAGSKIRDGMAKHLAEVALPAAYAAQFQSEGYAGLVERLRSAHKSNPIEWRAADAIEALLAERDTLKALLPNQNHESRAPIPTDWWSVAVLERRRRISAEKERDALAARLAPVDDYNLEILAAKEFIEATTDMPPRTTYTISKRSLSGARNAIAAIRPHIEAVERERCAKALEITSDEITRLRADLAAVTAERLTLRKALKPFAAKDCALPNDNLVYSNISFKVKDIRRARAALEGVTEKSGAVNE